MCALERKENIDLVLQRDYTVENVLGTGGFGTVYCGIRKQDSRAVSWLRLEMKEYYMLNLCYMLVIHS